MKLILERTYFSDGTSGLLWCGKQLVCHTIELPWKNNQRKMSCIPEGLYRLQKRYNEKHHWHLCILGVKNRQLILIHPANDALTELRGCIAPVTKITTPGKGIQSREACNQLNHLVFPILDKGEPVYILIQSQLNKF